MSDKGTQQDVPEILRVEDLVGSRELDTAQFAARHGHAFLVHYGSVEKMRRPQLPQRTQVFNLETPFHPAAAPRSLKTDYLVYPLRSTGRSPYPSMITVGRTRNNDVILPDESVSKFHAFFREVPGSTPDTAPSFVVQDAGSRNGTTMGGKPVPTGKQGPPIAVAVGDMLRFGLV